MQITIKYFGQLTEITHKDEESFEFLGDDITELLKTLFNKYKALETKDFQVAVNQEITSTDSKLTGTEVALLPPFSGG